MRLTRALSTSTRTHLAVVTAALAVSVSMFAARGLPPDKGFMDAISLGDAPQVERNLCWGASPLWWPPLHTACYWGCDRRTAVLELLLDAGEDVNATGPDGTTALHLAVTSTGVGDSSEAIVAVLLDHGASVDVRDDEGQTPLHLADDASVASLLVSAGADVNARDNRGRTPFLTQMRCVEPGYHEALVRLGANPLARDNGGNTAFHFFSWAVCHDDEFGPWNWDDDLAAFLVKQGLDINARNHDGDTPLHLAFHGLDECHEYDEEGNPTDLARWLPQMLALGANINMGDAQGNTPLHLFVRNPHAVVGHVRFVVGKGAFVNAKNNRGETPLHAAVARRDLELAEVLLALGANINARSRNGSTPLHAAAENKESDNQELARLIALGADPAAADAAGRLPVHRGVLAGCIWPDELVGPDVRLAKDPYLDALPRGKWADVWTPNWRQRRDGTDDEAAAEMARLLAAHPEILTARDVAGWSALHWAAATGRVPVAQALLDAGADVNAVEPGNDMTPLAVAASASFFFGDGVLELLLAHHADVNRRCRDGRTALHIAVAGGPDRLEAVRSLIDSGAEVNTRDSEGNTPLHAAVMADIYDDRLAALLLKAGADVNAANKAGDTPLHIAIAEDAAASVLQRLLDAGANVRAANAKGLTPLDAADSMDPGLFGGNYEADLVRSYAKKQ